MLPLTGSLTIQTMINDQFLVYDETPIWSAPFGLTLLETITMVPRINILDIGSGGGFPMIELAERFGISCQVYGLDPSEDSITMIREKIRLKEIRNASIIQGVAENIPFQDDFFGLITSNNGLNNVQDIGKTLRECFRVCRPSAQMIATMNLPHTMVEFYEVFEQILEEHGLNDAIQKMKKHIQEKRKPVEYWKELILDAGFSIKTINVDGFKYRYSDGSAFFHHFLIRNYFMGPWRSLIPEDKSGEIFRETEQKLNSLAEREGELVMEVPYVCFDCVKKYR